MKSELKFLSIAPLALAPFIASFSPAANAGAFIENFNAALSPDLQFTADSGFGMTLSDGRVVLTKTAGTGNGFAFLSTNFQLDGDFTISVSMTRDNLNGIGEAGLFVSFPSGFADVFAIGNGDIAGNIFVPNPPGYGATTLPQTTSTFLYGIQRVGSTLTLTVDQGVGPQVVGSATGANLTSPVSASIFLGQENGNTSAHAASFDNLTIQATAIVPEPTTTASVALMLLGACAYRLRPKKSPRSQAGSFTIAQSEQMPNNKGCIAAERSGASNYTLG